MASAEPIWCSNFLYNSRTVRNLDYQLADNVLERRVEGSARLKNGQPLFENDIPQIIFCVLTTKGEKLPDVFRITNGLLLVSERFKNLLQDFELGATQFFLVNVLERDRETPVTTGPFYLMNYTEFREIAVPEQIESARETGARWMVVDIKAKPVFVRPEHLDGLDFALDPVVFNLAFFSDRLVKAIRAEKIRPLGFVKCVAVKECWRS